MQFDEFCRYIEDPASFARLGKLSKKDADQCFIWLSLVDRTYLLNRLLKDEWANYCRTIPEPYFARICELVLYGQLASLATRAEPSQLYEFWEWALPQGRFPDGIRNLWYLHDQRFRASLGDGQSTVTQIVEQERDYALLLLACKVKTEEFPRQLGWATKAINRLMAYRDPVIQEYSDRAYCRLVFEWINRPSLRLRQALVLRFQLGAQLPRGQSEPLIDNSELFTESFLKTVRVVSQVTRRRHFHKLALQTSIWANPKDVLPPERLDGASGGAVFLLAQALANTTTPAHDGKNFTLYPWMSATSGLSDDGETLTESVGIKAKLDALSDDGVRVILVAPDNKHLKEAAAFAHKGQIIVPFDRPARDMARLFVEKGWVAPTDLRTLKQPTPSKVRIRSFIHLVFLIAAAGLIWKNWPTDETTAMRSHDEKALIAVAREYMEGRKTFAPDEEYGHLERPLPDAPYKGFRVHEVSIVWDSFYWAEVKDATQLYRRPIEPALSTTVFTLEKLSDDTHEFVRQLNTSGMGVHYLAPKVSEIPFLRQPEWRMKPLAEASVPTRTYLTSYDVSNQPIGKPFQIIERCILFNPTQDQTCRQKPDDWWGIRLMPGIEAADLAVRLPSTRRFYSPHKKQRDASRDEWTEPPNAIYEHAGDEVGSYSSSKWYVWRIPTEDIAVTTIYSIHWKWKTK